MLHKKNHTNLTIIITNRGTQDMSSDKKRYDSKKLQQIIKQLSGEINPDDGPLPPIHKIKGKGYMWCYSPMKKTMVKVNMGNKVYILDDEPDEKNQLMVYTPNEIIFIDKKEIIELGYN